MATGDKFQHNWRESTINRALDGSIYPGQKLDLAFLFEFFFVRC